MNENTKLYLKEFFNNYAAKTCHKQQLQVLAGSIQVLHQLVMKFMQQNCQHLPDLQFGHKSFNEFKLFKGNYTELHSTFSQLYKEISCVFKAVTQLLNNKPQGLTCSHEKWQLQLTQLEEPVQQDQLYGILNQYKISNKKLKEQKRCIESKLSQKNIMIINLQQEIQAKYSCIGQLQITINKAQTEIKTLISKIIQLQNHQKEFSLDKQLRQADMEQHRMTIQQRNQQILSLAKQNSNLKDSLKSCELKIEEFPRLLNQKAIEIQHKLSKKISEQISSKENWQRLNTHCLKKLINFSQKSRQK